VPNNVALNFRGSGFDGVTTRAQVLAAPHAFIESICLVLTKLSVGAQQLLRYLLKPLIVSNLQGLARR